MKIAYVTTYDVMNLKSWTGQKGTGYHTALALEEQSLSLEYISLLKEKFSLLFKGKQYLYKSLFNKQYLREREPFVLKSYAHHIASQLSKIKPDIVFSTSSLPIAYLECDQPIVFWTDATFAGMINFYPRFSNLCEETLRKGNLVEKTALDNCRSAIYTSEWAAQTAIKHYQVNPSKIKVVPSGANIECNRTNNDIKKIVESKSLSQCKLLFIGVDWIRKGGNVALSVAKKLNESGLSTELTIVGCQPIVKDSLPGFVRPMGFINRLTREGQLLIENLLTESHFLILPSAADCTPAVFREACSYGLPCLTTDVGGIPTLIRDGINGKTFSQDADAKEYCTYISNLFSDYSQYKNLALSSFNEYQSHLNWSVAGQRVKKLMIELVP